MLLSGYAFMRPAADQERFEWRGRGGVGLHKDTREDNTAAIPSRGARQQL